MTGRVRSRPLFGHCPSGQQVLMVCASEPTTDRSTARTRSVSRKARVRPPPAGTRPVSSPTPARPVDHAHSRSSRRRCPSSRAARRRGAAARTPSSCSVDPWSEWATPAFGWPAAPDGHLDGVDDELGADVIGDRPAHDPAGPGVEHDGEVDPALTGGVLGDVSTHSRFGRNLSRPVRQLLMRI